MPDSPELIQVKRPARGVGAIAGLCVDSVVPEFAHLSLVPVLRVP